MFRGLLSHGHISSPGMSAGASQSRTTYIPEYWSVRKKLISYVSWTKFIFHLTLGNKIEFNSTWFNCCKIIKKSYGPLIVFNELWIRNQLWKIGFENINPFIPNLRASKIPIQNLQSINRRSWLKFNTLLMCGKRHFYRIGTHRFMYRKAEKNCEEEEINKILLIYM